MGYHLWKNQTTKSFHFVTFRWGNTHNSSKHFKQNYLSKSDQIVKSDNAIVGEWIFNAKWLYSEFKTETGRGWTYPWQHHWTETVSPLKLRRSWASFSPFSSSPSTFNFFHCSSSFSWIFRSLCSSACRTGDNCIYQHIKKTRDKITLG